MSQAERIAKALSEWHFDEHMNQESEPAKTWRRLVADIIARELSKPEPKPEIHIDVDD